MSWTRNDCLINTGDKLTNIVAIFADKHKLGGKSIMRLRDYHILPKFRDGLGYLYLERGKIEQTQKAIEFFDWRSQMRRDRL